MYLVLPPTHTQTLTIPSQILTGHHDYNTHLSRSRTLQYLPPVRTTGHDRQSGKLPNHTSGQLGDETAV